MSTELKIYEDEAEKQYRQNLSHERYRERNKGNLPQYPEAKKAWAKANPEKMKAYQDANNRQQALKHWGEPEWIEKWIWWVREGRPSDWMLRGFVAAPGRFGLIEAENEWPNDAEEWDGCTDDIIWAAESYGRGLGRYDLLAIACELRLIRDAEEAAGMSVGKRSNESMGQITAVIRNGETMDNPEYQREWREKQKGQAA